MSNEKKIDYVEFSTTDLDKTKAFYSGVFGWTFQDWGPEYLGFTDGQTNGGFQKVDVANSGGPLIVLYSADLSAVKTAIKNSGGKIVKETFEFPGGLRFHFEDPVGNILAVWSDVA